jgi:hypothetical protein
VWEDKCFAEIRNRINKEVRYSSSCMKYLVVAIILMVSLAVIVGCTETEGTKALNSTESPASEVSSAVVATSSTILPVTLVPTTTPEKQLIYKTASEELMLPNANGYGFKIDYPSNWSFKQEHTHGGWDAGYNISSPDEKSYMWIGITSSAGSGDYYYPLYVLTPNALEHKTWESNIIEGYIIPSSIPPDYSRLISNTSITLSGGVQARKIVFGPYKDFTAYRYWDTYYIMHTKNMQGYNFTVPNHFEVATQVTGDVWDYGMGGFGYMIFIHTPRKDDLDSPIYEHMIQSFKIKTP